jgi:hypothetical protein
MFIANSIDVHLPYVAHYRRARELWCVEKRGISASIHVLLESLACYCADIVEGGA